MTESSATPGGSAAESHEPGPQPTSPHTYLWSGIVLSTMAGLIGVLGGAAEENATFLLLALVLGAIGTVLVVIGAAGIGVLVALAYRDHHREE